ncbi:MAG: threonine/serine exporter [Tissierellia bacterium]|nr:threonine/serine exporter [Tissierellia bacterium]
MNFIDLGIQFIYAFFATFAFAVFFNSPKESLIHTGIIGGFAWLSYIVISKSMHVVVSAFVASFLASALSEISSTLFKKPATVYLLPGLITLVPGAGTYYTLTYFIDGDVKSAYLKGTETLSIAVAIAFGILIASLFSKPIRLARKKKG